MKKGKPLFDNSKTIMLWNNDFRKRDWTAVCEALDLPEGTQEVELSVRVIGSFPYKHRVKKVDALSDVLRAYNNKSEPLEIAILPWDSNIKQEAVFFITALQEAGVAEIAVTDDSTNLLEYIQALVYAGAKLTGTVMIKRHPDCDDRLGLRFTIPERNRSSTQPAMTQVIEP